MHRPGDVDIVYKAAPRVQGWRERTGPKLWHIPLEPPQPKEPSTIDRLLLSRSPGVAKENLAGLNEVAHNVYELPTLGQGIQWMHAVCGYPAKDTWIKAIRAGNFVGWPLLTVKMCIDIIPKRTRHQWATSMPNVRAHAPRERSSRLSLCLQRRRRNSNPCLARETVMCTSKWLTRGNIKTLYIPIKLESSPSNREQGIGT